MAVRRNWSNRRRFRDRKNKRLAVDCCAAKEDDPRFRRVSGQLTVNAGGGGNVGLPIVRRILYRSRDACRTRTMYQPSRLLVRDQVTKIRIGKLNTTDSSREGSRRLYSRTDARDNAMPVLKQRLGNGMSKETSGTSHQYGRTIHS